MRFRVYYTDGRVAEADGGARVQVDAERRFDRSWPEFWRGAIRHEHFYYIAWRALVYDGQEDDGDFDEWLKGVADAEFAGLPGTQDGGTAEGSETSEGDEPTDGDQPPSKPRRRAASSGKERPTRQAQRPADSSS